MRHDDGVLVVPEKVFGEIRDVLSVTAVQKFLHGLGVDEFSTSKVQKNGVGAEVRNNILSDDSVGSIFSLHIRDIDGDVIGAGDGGGDRINEIHVTRQSHGRLDTEARIITLDLHSQGLGIPSCHGSDVTKSDHGKGLSLDFLSTEHGLVFFDTFTGQSLFSEILHVVDSIHNSTRCQKHTAQDQFLDGIGVGSGGVEDRNTKFCHARDGDVVGSGSASCDGSDGSRNIVLLKLVRSQQDSMGISGFVVAGSDVIVVLVEARQTDR
mmetsp:Transcript_7915/g.19104  ORF Transcript_7915/g.19104 Transcript_7915/m.19104 type:complete len:266 (+) Transcript_7915:523-1320(+)